MTAPNQSKTSFGRFRLDLMTAPLMLIGIFLLETSFARPLSATMRRGAERVTVSEETRIDDDMLITAGVCEIDGTVDGDILAVARDFRLRGGVTGAGIVAAEHSSIDGDISHSLGLLSRQVFVSGSIYGSSYIFAQKIEIDDEGLFFRDVFLACDSLFMGGTVSGRLRCYVGSATISGKIKNDLEINSDKALRILETANIGGDLIVHGGATLDIEDGAVIVGEVVRLDDKPPDSGGFSFGDVLWFFYNVGALFVLAAVTLGVSRAHFQRGSAAVRKEPLRSLAFGLIAFVAGLLITLALAITLAGLLTAALLFILLILIIFLLGPIYVAESLGALIISSRKHTEAEIPVGITVARVFIGLIILLAIASIPYAGFILYFFAGIVGLGAFIIGTLPGNSSRSRMKKRAEPLAGEANLT